MIRSERKEKSIYCTLCNLCPHTTALNTIFPLGEKALVGRIHQIAIFFLSLLLKYDFTRDFFFLISRRLMCCIISSLPSFSLTIKFTSIIKITSWWNDAMDLWFSLHFTVLTLSLFLFSFSLCELKSIH